MKTKITLAILMLFFLHATAQQIPTLVTNQPSFLVSSSGRMPKDPSQFFDGNLNTPTLDSTSGSGDTTVYFFGGYHFLYTSCGAVPLSTFNLNYSKTINFESGYFSNNSSLIIDLQFVKNINYLTLKDLTSGVNNSGSSFEILLFTSLSANGPWNQIKDTSYLLNRFPTDATLTDINKTSRFWKISIISPNYVNNSRVTVDYPTISGTGFWVDGCTTYWPLTSQRTKNGFFSC